jgi:hypothetical protein
MAPTYYCHPCASHVTGSAPIATSELTGSQYQLDKYIKHNAPQSLYPLNSVFASQSYLSYRDWIVSSAVSGALEVDEKGRHNFIIIAGETVGVTYVNGSFHTECSAVKVVLPYSATSIHAYPISAGALSSGTCARCAGPLAY